MPELPEVETIARALNQGGRTQPDGSLSPALPGMRITKASFIWLKTAASPSALEIERRLPNQSIQRVDRRGKLLWISLNQDNLLIHLRMSGDLLVEAVDAPIAPHHRFIIDFFEDYRLAFNDPRKFGRVWLTSNPQEYFAALGPEPLSNDFTPAVLDYILRHSQRQLKPLLLDQSKIAGLGNIYSDESLHRAGLHPLRLSNKLSPQETFRLWSAIRETLQEAIDRQGSSIDWVYRGGDFQNYFRVYRRTGLPCLSCGTPIQRIVVGQRGTHLCPTCQSLP